MLMCDDLRAGDIRARWLRVLKRLHGNCRGAPGRDDYLGFEVIDTGEDAADLVVHAFFKAGERYCCPEAGCMFDLGRDMWPRWRAAMAEECIDHLNPVRTTASQIHRD